MSRKTWAAGAIALWLIALAGCADNPMVLQGRVAQYQQQQSALQKQNELYQSRIDTLDRDNQRKEALLAQQQQQTKLLEDRLAAVTDQLRSTSDKLAQVQGEKQEVDTRSKALTASLRRQAGVSITPNNSFLQTLPAIRYPDVHVRRDGDVIRIELPGNQLFDPGGARVRPAAMNMIADVAIEIRRTYPDQLLGIEGHTDTDAVSGGQYRTNHELSAARALAVYDVLVNSQRYRPEQLFVVGHGANHPVVSNGTLEGKQRNRRVELVIYPDRLGQ
ncbi:MAG: OmpA family protein [Thermoguttaceae bacterium]|jgi:flagellar motor protein MotB